MWWSSKFMRIMLLVFAVVALSLVTGANRTARANEKNENLAINNATSACSMPAVLVSAARELAPLVPFRVRLTGQSLPPLVNQPSWFDQFGLFRSLKAQIQAPRPRFTFVPAALNRAVLWQHSLAVLSLIVNCIH